MPRANKRGAAESSGPARRSSRTPARAEPEPVKKARGASASSDASPAKATRKASPSPAPTGRGRSAKAALKGQGDESTPTKGRVTRAVVKETEEETGTSRGRSSTRKTDKPKEDPPARTGRGKSTGTPSKAKATPKGGRGRSARGRGKKEEPAEEEADDDEEEEEEEEEAEGEEEEEEEPEPPKKATPRGRAKTPAKSPAKAKTPSPSPAKKSPKTTPKPAASRSRSRGGKKEEIPSPQVVLEKMDTSDVMESKESQEAATEKSPEVEVKSPRGRRAKAVEKPSPSPSSRPARSRRGTPKKEGENSEESVEKAEKEQESSKDTEEPKADEKVDQEPEKTEEQMEEGVKEISEKSEEEKETKEDETTEPQEDSAEDLPKETLPDEKEDQEKSSEEPPTEQVPDEPEAAKESQEVEKAEEPKPEQKLEVPTINIEAASDAVEISDEDTASSLVAEPALSEAVQISDDSQSVPEEAVVVPEEEPVQSEPIAVDETPVPVQNSVTNEPEVMEVESNQSVEPVCTDGNLNGQPESRKRKIDDVEESEQENVEAKKACVTEEQVVQENGETSQPSEKENSAQVTQYMDDVTTRSTEDDYVMVNKADVPDSNSKEVLDSLPQQTSDNVQSKIDSIGKLGPLYNRKFIQNPSFKAESSDSSKQFTVVSYNILAQCHLERNDYSFTPSEFLSLEKRHQKMMSEFQYLDADVVCLQEVEPKYFEQLLQPAMLSLGYSGIMKKRTQEYFDEGEATFWKNSRFALVKSETSSLATLANKEVEDASLDSGVKASVQKYMDKPDVVVLTQLKCNFTNNVVTVGNIHVQWGKMEVPDIQCIQISCAIKALLNLAESDSNPHILCGDFNSEATSPGYQLVLEGFLSDDMIDQLQSIENVDMPDGSKKALFNQLYRAFQHPSSNIKSSYLSTQGTEPTVTSYNRVMRAAVDYIFYSAGSLDNVGVLEVASEAAITETGGIPNATFPSDHVSIKSTLSFK